MLAWDTFLQAQEKELGKSTVEKWLRTLKVVHFDACNLYLEAKDSIRALWFEEHIRPKLTNRFFNNNHHPIKVHLTIAEEPTVTLKKKEKNDSSKQAPLFLSDHLDPIATLDNFIPGVANATLLRFLHELPHEKESLFNPIYLYGPHSVGKTHLLMALAHLFKKRGLSVIYVHAETFTEHVVSAIRNATMREFRTAYRNVDLLIIDDIDQLARRSATQEELFHTFNTLHTAFRQIILSGLVPAHHLEDIEARLVSRFEWGISLPIKKLEESELALLLQQRLKALQLLLSEEIQAFLIARFKNSTHHLMRALEALILRSKGSPPLSVAKAAELLKDLIALEEQNRLTPQKIILFVANHYGITAEDILGKAQTQECTLPRQIAMFLCRQKLNLPYQKIGKLFTRDHSTVMTSIKSVQKKIDAKEEELVTFITGILA